MTVDTIVIGAGVIGAATARSLAEAGGRVLLLEAFERGHDRGSSHGATRIFRHGYVEGDFVELSIAAREEWRALERMSGRRLLETTGAVDHGDSGSLARIRATMTAAGLAAELVDAAEAGRRWPGLRFDGEALLSPDGGRLRANSALDTLLDAAARAGTELRFGAPVSGLEVDERGVVVEVGDETVRAARIVVAAGSWTPRLVGGWLSEQGHPLPEVRVTEEQPAHFPLRPASTAVAEWPSFVHHPRAGVSGAEGLSVYGLLTPGEGIKVGVHGNGPPVDPDVRDRRADPARLALLQDYVARWVPGADARRPAVISCLYDSTSNEDFVLDRVGPMTFATGFSGHGFKFAPVLGRMLAGLALGEGDVPERFRLAGGGARAHSG